MQNFTTKIVNMMKSEGLYASQGGPIILSQVRTQWATPPMNLFLILFCCHSFKKTHQWSCRLRMNTRRWKHPFMRKDLFMLNGQQTWRLAFRLVCHGSCASKTMRLTLWYIRKHNHMSYIFLYAFILLKYSIGR